MTASLQGVVSAHTTSAPGRSACLAKGHARGRGDMPQPITMVQYGGSSEKKRWDIAFLCHLNTWTKKDLYPLPRIQEALESMAGTAHFSLMDFKSRFWQVRMAPESQQYT